MPSRRSGEEEEARKVSDEVRAWLEERRAAYIIGVLLEKLGLAHLGAGELATDGRESVECCGKAVSQSGAHSSA